MAELKHKISRYTPFVVALIYAAITLYCVCFHEVWVDEAQVWMLCKYLNPIELFRHLTNEGHPFTFYLLVMPLSKTLNDIFYMHLLCWFSCVISVFLLWKYSPFSNFLKTVITLSAPFLYFFPVIARSYSIVPVLILILCVLYKKQQSHPFLYGIIILLLTNTHIIMGMFCFILSLYFVYDNIYLPYKKDGAINKKCLYSAFIMLFGGIILVLTLCGTINSNIYIGIQNGTLVDRIFRVILFFIYNTIDSFYIHHHINYFNAAFATAFLLWLILFILLNVVLYKKQKRLFFLLFVSLIFQLYVYVESYSQLIFPTRIFCFYMILLYCFWRLLEDEKQLSSSNNKFIEIILSFFFILTFFGGIKAYVSDIKLPYSGSKQIAGFIIKNIDLNKAKIFTNTIDQTLAVNYYLDNYSNIYWVKTGKKYKYIIWSKDIVGTLPSSFWKLYFDKIRKYDKTSELYALILHTPFESLYGIEEEWKDFEPVYINANTMETFENFILFKYKG